MREYSLGVLSDPIPDSQGVLHCVVALCTVPAATNSDLSLLH